jgi:ferrous iron transport protein B
MIDVANSRGISIDAAKLSALLGVPVIPTVARSGKGKDDLMRAALEIYLGNQGKQPRLKLSYGDDIDQALDTMEAMIAKELFFSNEYNPRWVALKYLENDEQVRNRGRMLNTQLSAQLEEIAEKVTAHLQATMDTYPEAMIADHRYGYIKSILKQDVISYGMDQDRLHLSDNIDRIAVNRFFGPLIMLAIVFGLYHFVFTFSETPVGWFESFFGYLGDLVNVYMPDGLAKSLVLSGIIDGVGGVLGFVPLIMFMFFGIAILEDSGYLPRVAFMLDRVFRMFGLHGSSVMAFIVSGGIAGGCAVPGVMATRTLKSPRERLATLLTVPFMNCGAKLPVFVLLVGAFFAHNQALMMFLITVIAWAGALLIAKLLRITVIKGAATPFVMELPPYRLPTFKGLLIHTWERTWQYIKKAGTVILSISILLWAMMTFPSLPESQVQKFEQERQAILASFSQKVPEAAQPVDEDANLYAADQQRNRQLLAVDSREAEAGLRHSIAGRIGTALESVSQWAGFDWRTNIALVGGFAAKEVIVSTLGTAYSLGDVDPEETGSLSSRLVKEPGWSPLVALSLILFTIFYAPCFVAVVCMVKEAGHWKWGLFSMAFNTVVAFSLAAGVYQGGKLLGF